MKTEAIILLGAGGHAIACIDVIEQHGSYRIAGLVGGVEEISSHRFGYSVIGSDHDLNKLVKSYRYAIVGVGQITSPMNRIRLYDAAIELGFEFPTIVSPFSYVSRHSFLGPGTIVMHGAVVNAGASLGANCIINTNAVVEHDVVVEDHTHISTGAIVNGSAHVGRGTFVGSGSIIRECTKIGKSCVIGMGATVRHDVSSGARIVGNSEGFN